jgi:hypothetical protein
VIITSDGFSAIKCLVRNVWYHAPFTSLCVVRVVGKCEVPVFVYECETVGQSVQKQTSKRRQERFWTDFCSKFNLPSPLILLLPLLFFLLLLLRWHYSPMWTFCSSQIRFPNSFLTVIGCWPVSHSQPVGSFHHFYHPRGQGGPAVSPGTRCPC